MFIGEENGSWTGFIPGSERQESPCESVPGAASCWSSACDGPHKWACTPWPGAAFGRHCPVRQRQAHIVQETTVYRRRKAWRHDHWGVSMLYSVWDQRQCTDLSRILCRPTECFPHLASYTWSEVGLLLLGWCPVISSLKRHWWHGVEMTEVGFVIRKWKMLY